MKDLNSEYRQLTADNVPDLWSRIEAGIDRLETENMMQTDSEQKKMRSFKRYIPMIAAAAALVLSVGVFMMNNGIKNSSEMAATADVAYYEDTAASEEMMADEAPSRSKSEDFMAADVAPMEESVMAADAAESDMEMEADMEVESAEDYAESETNDLEQAAGATKNAQSSVKASTDVIQCEGVINYCTDHRFVSILTTKGKSIRAYVPEDMRDIVDEAIAYGKKVTITYTQLDDAASAELGTDIDPEYMDVEFQIVDVE